MTFLTHYEKIVIFVCEFLIDAKTMDDGGNPENNSSIVSQYDTIYYYSKGHKSSSLFTYADKLAQAVGI